MMIKKLFPLFLFFLIVNTCQAAVTARLDRPTAYEGDVIQLIIEAEGQVSGNPDTTPLQSNFDVLGVSSGSQVTIINGRRSETTSWQIALSPKKNGQLLIPPITVNQEQTQPLSITVEKAPVASVGQNSPLFIETEVSTEQPYVQGQVIYTMRLFHGVKISSGNLTDPKQDNIIFKKLSEDASYTTQRNGRTYGVLERRYALFPQVSGELAIEAPVFSGRVQDPQRNRRSMGSSFFGGGMLDDMFAPTRNIHIRGQAQTLQVLPQPDNNNQHWIPAASLTITETWDNDGDEIFVGDPITRKIQIKADGILASQLPDIHPTPPQGISAYPDQGNSETHAQPNGVISEKSQQIAFIPNQPGNYTLPGIDIHWWNTKTNQAEIASLPEKTVQVVAAAGISQTPTATAKQQKPVTTEKFSQNPASPTQPQTATDTPSATTETQKDTVASWWPILAVTFAVAWLTTLLLWLFSNRKKNHAPQKVASKKTAENTHKKQFIKACREKNATAARRHLLAWAAKHWPNSPPQGLSALAKRIDDQNIQQALLQLEKKLYQDSNTGWDADYLAKHLTRLPSKKHKSNAPPNLPDLYPESTK